MGGQTVHAFEAGDFDGDGTIEAFGAVGEAYIDGTLYFVTGDGVYEVLRDGLGFSEDDGLGHLLDFGTVKFYTIEQSYGGSGSSSLIYGVKNGEWYEHELSQRGEWISQIEGTNDMTIVDGTHYDFLYLDGEEAGGHTWKTYYLHYDSDRGFEEYGGITITEEQLLLFDGAEEALNQIKDSGAAVQNIIYRMNGIININYVIADTDDGMFENHNMTLTLNGISVVSAEENDGIYEEAFLPDIAVYPAGLEFGIEPVAEEVP